MGNVLLLLIGIIQFLLGLLIMFTLIGRRVEDESYRFGFLLSVLLLFGGAYLTITAWKLTI